MGEKQRDEWRGWRFVLLSLLVTASCIIFFFAGRHFFPTIKERTRYAWGALTQRVMEWGGVRLNSIELQLLSDPSEVNRGDLMQPFDSLSVQLKEELSIYYGVPFWGLDLQEVKDRVLAAGWPKSVYLRRSFPDTLKIQVLPRQPVLWVRSSKAWVAVDEEGCPLLLSQNIPGQWAHLAVVYGLEGIFDRGRNILELRRQLVDEKEALKDAYQLNRSLTAQVGVDVESISIREEPWTKTSLLTARFSMPLKLRDKVHEESENSQTKYEVTFLSHDWAQRVSSLQFVLSDLSTKPLESVRILGQYSGRWIVEDLSPKKVKAPEVQKAAVKKSGIKLKRRKH
jgi:hypothetical protein